MPALCLCYEIHEPYRLRRYTVFDMGQNSIYEDDDRNCDTLLHAARLCYLPMIDLLLRLIRRHGQDFRLALCVSCTALDQFEQYAPEVLDGLKALAATGCVEFMAETGPHTMAFLYSREEFVQQVKDHAERTRQLFGKKPVTFRNSELIYNNDLSAELEKQGFKAVLAEGAGHVLGWRSANYVYSPVSAPKMRLLLRNTQLSNDICRRFCDSGWDQWPLTAEKFASWCRNLVGKADIINIFNDFHVFGLRNGKESGIFDFMEALPAAILESRELSFITPSEAVKSFKSMDSVDVPQFMSWDDEGSDLTNWLGNDMQKDAIHTLYGLAPRVRKLNDPGLLHDFKRLQTSEHFFYISTKWFAHFSADRPNPYPSPYDAYITYMNVLADFEMRLAAAEEAAASPVSAAGRKTGKAVSVKKATAQSAEKGTPRTRKTEGAATGRKSAAVSAKRGEKASSTARAGRSKKVS